MSRGHTITTQRTGERVRVVVAGEVVADSTSPVVLHETGLPPRYYLPRADVRMDLLVATDTTTTCPFKGDAEYWTARLGEPGGEVDVVEVVDVAWSYPAPIPERADITGLVCFYAERVDEHTVSTESRSSDAPLG